MADLLADAGIGMILGAGALTIVGSAGIGLIVSALLRRFFRRLGVSVLNGAIWRSPVVLVFALSGLQVYNQLVDRPWTSTVESLVNLGLIAAVAWLFVVATRMGERAALARFPDTDISDLRSRQIRTQIAFLHRVAVAVIAIIAVGSLLWSFPAVRELGAGVLASAGVVSIIAGLAAQTVLGNVFAGMQIAWSDRIRTGDIVVIDDEWGHIETITLTYVVVQVWNGTNLIVPSTYFTSTPFRNWTHMGPKVVAEVDVAADWSVPVEDVRAELARAVDGSPLWDGRRADLVVKDATATGLVLTAFVSAIDGDNVAALRWHVREALVAYLQRHPSTIPRLRGPIAAPPDT